MFTAAAPDVASKELVMRFPTCAAAAFAALALSAQPADAALVLTFQVDVTGWNGGADFTPFSFTQTWTLSPGPHGVEDPIVTASTPAVVQAMQALEGPAAVYQAWAGAPVGEFRQPGSAFELEAYALGEPYPFDLTLTNTHLDRRRYHTADLDLDFVAFLQSGGPYAFSLMGPEIGDLPVGEFRGPHRGPLPRRYSGVATLVSGAVAPGPSAVPEPAAWALMIAGFGLAGAALRRMRSVARAA